MQYTCSDPTVVSFILGKIQSGSQFLVNCNGYAWRQLACSGSTALCVDCSKSCSDCPGVAFVMRPCGNLNLDQCYTFTSVASSLELNVRKKITYPTFVEPINLVSISKTAVSLNLNLTRSGKVYCSAIDSRYTFPGVL